MPVAALAVFGLSMAMVGYTDRTQAASATDAIPPTPPRPDHCAGPGQPAAGGRPKPSACRKPA